MKKPWLAFLFSFFLAGAGLAYLGKWKWAVLNLLAVLGVGFFFAYFAPDRIDIVAAAVGALDGGIAKTVAEKMNATLLLQPVPVTAAK